MIVKDKEKLESFGTFLQGKFDTYEKERTQLEQQWLKNLRQYKGVYDPDVKIPEGRSKVYPKDTRTKIVGWVAKMMEMMFPAQEKNYSLKPTPYPNISQADLQNILTALAQQAEETGVPVTSEMIEKAVRDFAEERALAMEEECEDQLCDDNLDYPELCKKVLRRGGIYGFGVAEGPLVRTQAEREWKQDPQTGQFAAVSSDVKRPYYVPLKAWDVYPDLSAQRWEDQEGIWTRKVFPRHMLRTFAKREDFFGSVIEEYLADHDRGNYKARAFEGELNELKKTAGNAPDMSRQFEVLRWYGYLSGKMLSEVGVEVPESALKKDILADVWLMDGVVISADLAPFGEKVSDMFHVFIPDEDEDGPLTGTARAENLRDSQLKLCAIDRATMDNMARAVGPIVELNEDLLAPTQSRTVSGGDTILRTGEGQEANYPAVRTYDIPSHIPELLELREAVVQVFDRESNLPSWRMGDAQPLGEAFRTSNNMSMMAGGGDMVTKDDVRAFDRFVKSLIGSLVRWNMEFNDKPEIKGDFQVMPMGSISLVAKEVRGQALTQLKQTLTPREMVLVRTDGLVLEQFKVRDLPIDLVLKGKEAEAALAAFDQQQSAAAQVQQGLDQAKTQNLSAKAAKDQASASEIAQMVEVKVQEVLSKIAANLAKVKGVKDGTALQSAKLLLDASKPEGKGAGTGKAPKGAAAG